MSTAILSGEPRSRRCERMWLGVQCSLRQAKKGIPGKEELMNSKKSDRRRFLKESTAVAVGALGAQSGLAAEAESAKEPNAGPKNYGNYGERSRFVTTARKDDYLS